MQLILFWPGDLIDTIYAYMNTLKGASSFKGSTFKSAQISTF